MLFDHGAYGENRYLDKMHSRTDSWSTTDTGFRLVKEK